MTKSAVSSKGAVKIPIAIRANTFIEAYVFANMFFRHASGNSFDIDLVARKMHSTIAVERIS